MTAIHRTRAVRGPLRALQLETGPERARPQGLCTTTEECSRRPSLSTSPGHPLEASLPTSWPSSLGFTSPSRHRPSSSTNSMRTVRGTENRELKSPSSLSVSFFACTQLFSRYQCFRRIYLFCSLPLYSRFVCTSLSVIIPSRRTSSSRS